MNKHKIGFAFSGGGVKGASHCGALQAMHEFGIKADMVAGTSVGSIVATFYAAGIEPIEMVNVFSSLDFRELLGIMRPKGGLFDSKPLEKHLRKIIPFENFEDLPIETIAVATCIENGKVEYFNRGEIVPRIVASCSIPIIFQPFKIGDLHYLDGGVLMNLPVIPLRDKCEKVIALNLHHAGTVPYKDNIVSIAMRSSSLMFLSNSMIDSTQADIFIDMDTAAYNAYDMKKVDILFQIGYDTTVKVLEENGYIRVMPPQKIAIKHKEKQPGKMSEMMARAQEMLVKSDELRSSAKKIIAKVRRAR